MGPIEEKKALQKKSNICVGIAIFSFLMMFLVPQGLGTAGSVVLLIFGGTGAVNWVLGLMAYTRSKGYPALVGLVCLLGFLGLLVLLLLPDQWKVNVPPVVSPSNYPRDPSHV